MRRKKSPILLISMVCLAGAGVLMLSKPMSQYNMSPEEQMAQMRREAAERDAAKGPDMDKKNAPEPTQLASGAKERLLQAGKKAPMPSGGGPEGEGPVSTVPSVVMPEAVKVPKPVRNESSVQGQWWR